MQIGATRDSQGDGNDSEENEGHDAVGIDVAGHHNGRALPGELVDDVEQFQGPAIGGLVELEVEGPQDVGPDRAHGPHHHSFAAQRLLALPIGDFEAFGTPEALYPLVVDLPAFAPGHDGRPSPAPARTRGREGAQAAPQGHLVVAGDGWCIALGGPVLADDPAGVALGDPEPIDERAYSLRWWIHWEGSGQMHTHSRPLLGWGNEALPIHQVVAVTP